MGMLILTRYAGEAIIVGKDDDKVVVRYLGVDRDSKLPRLIVKGNQPVEVLGNGDIVAECQGKPVHIRQLGLDTFSDQVRIGIDAPREIGVHREEIFTVLHGPLGS